MAGIGSIWCVGCYNFDCVSECFTQPNMLHKGTKTLHVTNWIDALYLDFSIWNFMFVNFISQRVVHSCSHTNLSRPSRANDYLRELSHKFLLVTIYEAGHSFTQFFFAVFWPVSPNYDGGLFVCFPYPSTPYPLLGRVLFVCFFFLFDTRTDNVWAVLEASMIHKYEKGREMNTQMPNF